MSIATEHNATIGVEAAARLVYETNREATAESLRRSGVLPTAPPWDDLSPLAQREFREAVLPIVWEALKAIPDPRREVWLEGYIVADNGGSEESNPYPEEA